MMYYLKPFNRLISMNMEIFTNKFRIQSRVLTLFTLLIFYFTNSHLIAQCTLACDDNVQVSVNQNCQAVITPSMMLEDTTQFCTYTVIVYDISGLPLPSPIVNSSHLNQTLRVRVLSGANSCWGQIFVQDKFRPTIICPPNDTIYCNNVNYTPLSPVVSDNCGGLLERHLISDNTVKYPCDSALVGKRTITYFYTDTYNNSSDTCRQMIWYKKVDSALIVWPTDKEFSCQYYTTTPPLAVTGVPTIGGNPLYPSWGNCNIALTFEDERISVCPGTFKILRKWTLLDWCKPSGSNVNIRYQVIKVVDNEGPVVSCAVDMTVSTDVWSCTGTAIIEPPTIIRECSTTSLSVGYKTVSPTGDTTFNGSNTSNIVILSNGLVSVTNLPLGLNWVIFRLTDQCGNYTDCATEVRVLDKVAPVAVCDQKTTVSLTVDGTAKVDAFTFDDGSHDNCALDRYEVSRMDVGTWGPYAYFGCTDIGKTIMVNFRIWDKSNNSNTCMVEVVVQDKLGPVITCPPNMTIPCEVDNTDLNLFGKVALTLADRKNIVINNPNVVFSGPAIDGYAYDACGVTITSTPFSNITCGVGSIVRTFIATDVSKLTSVCQQIITIQDKTANNIVVVPPADYFNNTTCLTKPDLTPAVTGSPTITGADKCSNVAVTHEDLTFTFEPDACLKILRRWYVIDWCLYKPNDVNPKGFWTHVQVIKISNTVPPNFTSNCADRTVEVFGPGCQGQVSLIARAVDDCTDTLDLNWVHEVDIDNNNSIDAAYSGLGRDASGVYPVGDHKVTFRVKDNCGNEKVCSFLMHVVDGKKPTPYCRSSITTVIMPTTKSLEIWASDYNLNSEDNCTAKQNLKYYFLINGTYQPSITFNCSNIGKNKIKMYVVDERGNFDYCEVEIELQDPNRACPTGTLVQGTVTTPDGKGVNNVAISWERTNPNGTSSINTDLKGNYAFPNIVPGMDYTFRASKNYDHLNGVTTQDILIIQKHILGKQTFDTPYKYIAADANNTKSISAADLSEIRKLILGVNGQFVNNQESWRFVPVSYVFPDQTNPFPYLESIQQPALNGNISNMNFYAIKIGDMTGNVDVGSAQGLKTRTNGALSLVIKNEDIKITGNEVEVPVSINQNQLLSGLQMSFEFAAELEFEKITSGVLNLSSENYNQIDNKVRISQVNDDAINFTKGQTLFTLHFKSSKMNAALIKSLGLAYSDLSAEAYDENNEALTIRLEQRDADKKALAIENSLDQNTPNPFTNETTVSYSVNEAQSVNFVIFDLDGKVIRNFDKEASMGKNEFKITKNELGKAGVYFIQMNTSQYTETKKMVLIR